MPEISNLLILFVVMFWILVCSFVIKLLFFRHNKTIGGILGVATFLYIVGLISYIIYNS